MTQIEATDEVLWILGRPNFACAGIANTLRLVGQEIPRRAESEQAAAILWMLNLYLLHGEEWRTKAEAILESAPNPPSQPKAA